MFFKRLSATEHFVNGRLESGSEFVQRRLPTAAIECPLAHIEKSTASQSTAISWQLRQRAKSKSENLLDWARRRQGEVLGSASTDKIIQVIWR